MFADVPSRYAMQQPLIPMKVVSGGVGGVGVVRGVVPFVRETLDVRRFSCCVCFRRGSQKIPTTTRLTPRLMREPIIDEDVGSRIDVSETNSC